MDSLTWEWNPSQSQVVRTLLYLAEGILYGVFLSATVLLTRQLIPGLLGGEFLPYLLLIIILIFAARFALLVRVAARSEPTPKTRVVHEWRDVRRWPLTAAVSIAVGLPLVAAGSFYWEWYEAGTKVRRIGAISMLVGITFYWLAHFLSSSGKFDPERMTLSYNTDKINLRFLTSVKRITVGERAFLWMTFKQGYASDIQRLYTVPIEIANQVTDKPEAKITAAIEDRETHRPSTTVLFISIAILVGIPFSMILFVHLSEAPLGLAMVPIIAFGPLLLAVLWFVLRTS